MNGTFVLQEYMDVTFADNISMKQKPVNSVVAYYSKWIDQLHGKLVKIRTEDSLQT